MELEFDITIRGKLRPSSPEESPEFMGFAVGLNDFLRSMGAQPATTTYAFDEAMDIVTHGLAVTRQSWPEAEAGPVVVCQDLNGVIVKTTRVEPGTLTGEPYTASTEDMEATDWVEVVETAPAPDA